MAPPPGVSVTAITRPAAKSDAAAKRRSTPRWSSSERATRSATTSATNAPGIAPGYSRTSMAARMKDGATWIGGPIRYVSLISADERSHEGRIVGTARRRRHRGVVIQDDCFAPVAATSIDDLLRMGGCGIDVEVHVTEQGRVHDQKRSLAQLDPLAPQQVEGGKSMACPGSKPGSVCESEGRVVIE